eukprot:Nitzschia sp. Nitz4//scaffold67_size101165//78403//79584//NITZ4_004538-RA/size101165-augustus-gene-0.16-mRNA-1//1//CDS//3329556501//9104//frame0
MSSNASSNMMLRIDELDEIFPDITPLPQPEAPSPVCAIQYPTAFGLAMDTLRACRQAGETSERALKLSATCLKLNPANYTVWHYRRECLQGMEGQPLQSKAGVQADLDFASQLGGKNPKNYQIWYHRRALLEHYHKHHGSLQDFLTSELAYLKEVLGTDAKNYHAWSHRQWVVRTANDQDIWEKEVLYAAELIEEDPRNNSAWNERWFAAHQAQATPLEVTTCCQEADFAILHASKDPYNESPFRYLVALLREQPNSSSLYATYLTKVQALESVLVEAKRDPPTCVQWTNCRVDLYEGVGDKVSLQQAMDLATTLANEHDVIRKKYWSMRVSQWKDRVQAMV